MFLDGQRVADRSSRSVPGRFLSVSCCCCPGWRPATNLMQLSPTNHKNAGWTFAFFNSKAQEERKARIERVNEQL
jgi:hypothetical protein